jgi:hypothetical protein
MATRAQIHRLVSVEESLPGESPPDKPDLSLLATPELRTLRRWIAGDFDEHDRCVVETVIGPKLVAAS